MVRSPRVRGTSREDELHAAAAVGVVAVGVVARGDWRALAAAVARRDEVGGGLTRGGAPGLGDVDEVRRVWSRLPRRRSHLRRGLRERGDRQKRSRAQEEEEEEGEHECDHQRGADFHAGGAGGGGGRRALLLDGFRLETGCRQRGRADHCWRGRPPSIARGRARAFQQHDAGEIFLRQEMPSWGRLCVFGKRLHFTSLS